MVGGNLVAELRMSGRRAPNLRFWWSEITNSGLLPPPRLILQHHKIQPIRGLLSSLVAEVAHNSSSLRLSCLLSPEATVRHAEQGFPGTRPR